MKRPHHDEQGAPDLRSPSTNGSGKRRLLLKVLVSLVILAILIRRADFGEMEVSWDARTAAFVFLGITTIGGALFLSAVRWWVVLWSGSCSLSELFRAYLLGWLSSLFLPSTVAGDAVRVAVVTRGTTGAGAAVSSIVLERSLGFASLILCLAVGVLIEPSAFLAPAALIEWSVTGRQAQIAVLILTGASVLLWTQRHRLQGLVHGVRQAVSLWSRFGKSPGRMAMAAAVAIGVQVFYIVAWWAFAHALSISLSWGMLLVYVPLVSLVALLPVTIAGLGVREGAWVFLLAPLGAPIAAVVTFSLLYYLSTLLVALLLGGFIFLVLPTLSGHASATGRHSGAAEWQCDGDPPPGTGFDRHTKDQAPNRAGK